MVLTGYIIVGVVYFLVMRFGIYPHLTSPQFVVELWWQMLWYCVGLSMVYAVDKAIREKKED